MNVIVIGGGASGLMAAITAAKGGHSVTLLERQARVGRKLLSTGNGRCNLTNLNMGLPYYHGQNAAFIRPAFEALSLDATLDFFHGLGLLTTAERTVNPCFVFFRPVTSNPARVVTPAASAAKRSTSTTLPA